MFDLVLVCYRYYPYQHAEYSLDHIWQQVEAWGGHMEFHAQGVDFYFPPCYRTWFVIQWPTLIRQPQLDYC